MRNFLTLLILSATVLFFVPVTSVNAQSDKVTVCQNGNTISVASQAVQALLNQGATLGPCAPTSVPEFGFATGAVAVIGAGVAYIALKKNYAKTTIA